MKAKVTITRGRGATETFTGEVLAMTDTHLFVVHGPFGEWFAVTSKHVNCTPVK